MTPRLTARLGRLEAARSSGGGCDGGEGGTRGDDLPEELRHVLILVLAVELGGYPRPRDVRQGRDILGDAFARALGVRERGALDDLGAGARGEWHAAVDAAVRRLAARQAPGGAALLDDPARAWCWLLDRYAALRVRCADLGAWRDADVARLWIASGGAR